MEAACSDAVDLIAWSPPVRVRSPKHRILCSQACFFALVFTAFRAKQINWVSFGEIIADPTGHLYLLATDGSLYKTKAAVGSERDSTPVWIEHPAPKLKRVVAGSTVLCAIDVDDVVLLRPSMADGWQSLQFPGNHPVALAVSPDACCLWCADLDGLVYDPLSSPARTRFRTRQNTGLTCAHRSMQVRKKTLG